MRGPPHRRTVPDVLVVSTDKHRLHREDCAVAKRTKHKRPATPEDKARPCRRCFPDAPVLQIVKRKCKICSPDHLQPCQHNGGVRVVCERKSRRKADGTQGTNRFIRWVWPDSHALY